MFIPCKGNRTTIKFCAHFRGRGNKENKLNEVI